MTWIYWPAGSGLKLPFQPSGGFLECVVSGVVKYTMFSSIFYNVLYLQFIPGHRCIVADVRKLGLCILSRIQYSCGPPWWNHLLNCF